MQHVLFRIVSATSLLLVCSQTAVTAPILVGGIGFGSQSNRGRVATISEVTGGGTLLPGQAVSPRAGLNGLTFDSAGALYGSAISNPVFADPASGAPTLVQLDPKTGDLLSGVPITFGNDPLEVLDLAAQPGTGLIYGLSFTSESPGSSLYVIDKATGTATLRGSTNVIGVTLAFGPTGALYMTSATFDDQGQTGSFLHTVNPSTGAVVTTDAIATVPSGNLLHVGGLAVRPTDGVLFASAREADVERRGDVYRLTPSGTPTLLGSTGVGDVGDLAFAPIPEPTSLLLISSALAVIGALRKQKRTRTSWAARRS
jgi:hypothetical protein